MLCRYSHWMPLVTRCPLRPWSPDVGYFTVETNDPIEIFAFRRIVFKHWWRKEFMETIHMDILKELMEVFKEDAAIKKLKYRMLTGRVEIETGA